jgi:hypothetical protein
MSERGTRLERSVVTFGPLGRMVATGVVLAPLWFFYSGAGVLGLAGIVVWIGWVLPIALRDVWRPALLPSTDLTRLRDAARREAEHQRRQEERPTAPRPAPPTRW